MHAHAQIKGVATGGSGDKLNAAEDEGGNLIDQLAGQ